MAFIFKYLLSSNQMFRIFNMTCMALAMVLTSNAYAFDFSAPVHCQVMGMHMVLPEDDINVDGNDYRMTIFGAAAQAAVNKDRLEYGFEFGLLFSWDNDSRFVEASSGSSGGEIKIQFENKMLLIDYFGGGYVGYSLTPRLRVYTGGGLLIVYGRRTFDPDESKYEDLESEVESKLSLGFYGRTGIEFGITKDLMLGAGIRAMTSGLKFTEPNGKISYRGVQYVFNLSYQITAF